MNVTQYILLLIIGLGFGTDSKSQTVSDSTKLAGYFKEFYEKIPSYDSCILVLKKAESLAAKINDRASLARSIDLLGWCYSHLKDYDSAKYYYNKALQIAISIKDSLRIGNIYNHVSNLRETRGKYDESLKYAYKSFSIYKKLNHYSKYPQSYNNIGNIFFKIGNYEKANEYFQKTVKSDTIDQTKKMTINAVGNLMANYLTENNKIKVDSLSEEIERLIEEKQLNREEFYNAHFNYSIYLANNNNKEAAIKLYKEILDYNILDHKSNYKALIYLNFAEWYLKINIDSSKYYLKYANKIIQDLKNNNTLLSSYRTSSEVYEYSENYDSAYLSLKNFIRLYDSIYNIEVFNEINNIHLNLERDSAKNELVKKDKVIKTKTNLNYLLVLIVLFSLILIIVIAIFANKNYLKNKIIEKKNRELEINRTKEIEQIKKEHEFYALQNIVKSQELERKRIASDLHDRLGAKLSALKLYMSVPSNSKTGMKLLDEIISESREISHNIYSGTLEKYGILHAIEDLLYTIQNTGKVSVDFSFEEIVLDLEQEKSLYCIIQELINNTLKHANASKIFLKIVTNKAREILVEYSDNGKGYDFQIKQNGLGFKNIASRISILNAKINITKNGLSPIIKIKIPNDSNTTI